MHTLSAHSPQSLDLTYPSIPKHLFIIYLDSDAAQLVRGTGAVLQGPAWPGPSKWIRQGLPLLWSQPGLANAWAA